MSLNTVIIICLIAVFIFFIFLISIKTQQRKRRLHDVLEALSYIAVILTLAYAVFSYTYNIYPTFQKEDELRQLNEMNLSLNNENSKLHEQFESLNEEKIALGVQNMELNQQLEDAKKELNIVTDENFTMKATIGFQQECIQSIAESFVYECSSLILSKAIFEHIWNAAFSESDVAFASRILALLNSSNMQSNSIEYEIDSFMRGFVLSLPNDIAISTTSDNITNTFTNLREYCAKRYGYTPGVYFQDLSSFLQYEFSFPHFPNFGEIHR